MSLRKSEILFKQSKQKRGKHTSLHCTKNVKFNALFSLVSSFALLFSSFCLSHSRTQSGTKYRQEYSIFMEGQSSTVCDLICCQLQQALRSRVSIK